MIASSLPWAEAALPDLDGLPASLSARFPPTRHPPAAATSEFLPPTLEAGHACEASQPTVSGYKRTLSRAQESADWRSIEPGSGSGLSAATMPAFTRVPCTGRG